MKTSEKRQEELKNFDAYAKYKTELLLEKILNTKLEKTFDLEDIFFGENRFCFPGYILILDEFVDQFPYVSEFMNIAEKMLSEKGYLILNHEQYDDKIQEIIKFYRHYNILKDCETNHTIFLMHKPLE